MLSSSFNSTLNSAEISQSNSKLRKDNSIDFNVFCQFQTNSNFNWKQKQQFVVPNFNWNQRKIETSFLSEQLFWLSPFNCFSRISNVLKNPKRKPINLFFKWLQISRKLSTRRKQINCSISMENKKLKSSIGHSSVHSFNWLVCSIFNCFQNLILKWLEKKIVLYEAMYLSRFHSFNSSEETTLSMSLTSNYLLIIHFQGSFIHSFSFDFKKIIQMDSIDSKRDGSHSNSTVFINSIDFFVQFSTCFNISLQYLSIQ